MLPRCRIAERHCISSRHRKTAAGLHLAPRLPVLGEEIVIHETEGDGLDSSNSIAPVLSAWKEMATARRIGANQSVHMDRLQAALVGSLRRYAAPAAGDLKR